MNFNQLDQKLGAVITVHQKNYLYFGGTAYLGIPQNKAFIAHYIEGINKYGLNNGTSRGNNVQLGIYNEAEAYMARQFGSEAALVTSSGYLAAKLTVQAYANEGQIRYAPNTHPALWQVENPQVALSFKAWTQQVVSEINQSEEKNWVLIANAMDNIYPEIYDFGFIANIRNDKNVVLIIDDSHGIGMLNGGVGVLKGVPKLPQVEVVVAASMAKALGLDAGVVLASSAQISKLKQTNEFYGASPPAAAGLYAFMQAESIYKTAYEEVCQQVQYFKQGLLDKNDWHFVGDFPVFLCKQPAIDQKLLQANILISSFPYPDKNGPLLNRIVLASWHKKADIDTLLSAI